ncbi:glutathione S-transferase family protein [Hahella ganghwensis]|uniref:glutathione S-transferase family protein n=1 Tax=Hahella ganghwensis TaxID=286420 RepID=UPI000367EC67|nr:glutathione S-transferase family protein [Hahella ganghwensis]
MNSKITLISHHLCPYVQRAAILLEEKGIPYERVNIDLSNKPDWFLAISPLGKTPVLLVDSTPIFESAVICEYLEEVYTPRLHPDSPLEKARHRSWIEFGSSILNDIASFYNAADKNALINRSEMIQAKFRQLEQVVEGPFFSGRQFTLVDAVYGPVFRYFDTFDTIDNFGFLTGAFKVDSWRLHLSARPSIINAVSEDYPERLQHFLLQRKSALSEMISKSARVESCLA